MRWKDAPDGFSDVWKDLEDDPMRLGGVWDRWGDGRVHLIDDSVRL